MLQLCLHMPCIEQLMLLLHSICYYNFWLFCRYHSSGE